MNLVVCYIVFYVCINSVAAGLPRILSKWPAVVTYTPKCPTTPKWEDLRPNLKELALKGDIITNLQLLKVLEDQISKCENHVVELDAEEIPTEVLEENEEEDKEEDDKKVDLQEAVNDQDEVENDDDKQDVYDREDEEENIKESPKKGDFSVPIFMPIFKPKNVRRSRTYDEFVKDMTQINNEWKSQKFSNIAGQNLNTLMKPLSEVIEQNSLNHDNAGRLILETKPINDKFSKTITVTRNVTLNSEQQPAKLLPSTLNETDYIGFDELLAQISKSAAEDLKNINSRPTPALEIVVPTSRTLEHYNPSPKRSLPLPVNHLMAALTSRSSRWPNEPPSTPLFHSHTNSHNAVPSNTLPLQSFTKPTVFGPVLNIPSNSHPLSNTPPCAPNVVNYVSNPTPSCICNNVSPSTSTPCPVNPNSVLPLKPLPANRLPKAPLKSTPTLSYSALSADCNPASNICGGAPDKHNLVFFKPEDVELVNIEGDVLKKVQMTVLVPTYVSAIDV